jgi:hypothetical protein
VGACQLFAELADFGGEFPVSGVGGFRRRRRLASEALRGGDGSAGAEAVRSAQLLNGLPDVGLAVEPGAADPGRARDELEGDRPAAGFELTQRVAGALQRLLPAALSGGAQVRAVVSRHGH